MLTFSFSIRGLQSWKIRKEEVEKEKTLSAEEVREKLGDFEMEIISEEWEDLYIDLSKRDYVLQDLSDA